MENARFGLTLDTHWLTYVLCVFDPKCITPFLFFLL